MDDKSKIDYHLIFKQIEKVLEADGQFLECNQCGRSFIKISFVDKSEPDFIFYGNEEVFKCEDHLLYDLLVNPLTTEPIRISLTKNKKLGRKLQVEVRNIDAAIFLPDRLN